MGQKAPNEKDLRKTSSKDLVGNKKIFNKNPLI